MSPFSVTFHKLRVSRGICQHELGEELQVTQRYLSSLETGSKNPPSEASLLKIAAALQLTDVEKQELIDAARASTRKYLLSTDAPIELYWMMQKLWRAKDHLRGSDIEFISQAIEMTLPRNSEYKRPVEKIKRRRKEESRM